MLVMNGDYENPKRYEISGVEVCSEIDKDETTPDYRFVHIKTSCQSHRWGTRTIGFSLTLYNNPQAEGVLKSLEKHRLLQANRLVKIESGDVPEGVSSFLGVQIQGPSGKTINCAALADLGVVPSLLSRDLVDVLELQPLAKTSFQEQLISSPLYRATIMCGPIKIETIIAVSDHGGPGCILGGDFFQKALAGDQKLIQDLIMPDDVRALASAARCKKRFVLIAGAYGRHRSRLDRIKQSLSSLGFVGLILNEYLDIEEQTLPEKMVTFASIARFVMVDDISPSGHIEELGICRERGFVTAILRFQSRPSTAMQAAITGEISFMREFGYSDDSALGATVLDAARWADEAVFERARTLNRLYGEWRNPNKIM
jgi:hypothetical protein